ncbi:isocitrate lyase/phosphoenolpyruvate mutase family protein [Sphingomonas gilva]|uniref:Isocitrate lyase/phosphoenolpyruvate mutase family protein n=1 Tax=Sphingomonas gilva TaxID=2305907 RepID=A0A396RT40_9SPHN|nr:isocitrate lyase/phosphoenolpyruvate mutase family protein [Sphingomonas gilva]RHW16791.1 isocitrate lyase/phosphoenolpyruvate mutase family protein [Sphingomonas gilva]
MTKFADFAALHVAGDPLILFNAWDAGSAKVVAEAGAKAIATGSASVAGANGYADGEGLPLDFVIANLERIVGAVDLPVTLDFEGGYATDADEVAANVRRVRNAGAVGINFEDQVVDGEGLHAIADQAARIAAIRAATGPDFFINARTDLFLKKWGGPHDQAMIDEAVARGVAYAEAGASGYFVPGMVDIAQVAEVCRRVALPINFMAYPGAPDAKALAEAGIARISHGPFPWKAAMAALKEAAEGAYS